MERETITELLSSLQPGDRRAANALLEAVYTELRDLADVKLRQERADHVLQPTALVHEAYVKLVDQDRVRWQGRTHFRAVAAQAMQRILVDHARHRDRLKRGGGWRKVDLENVFARAPGDDPIDVVALDEALARMRSIDPRQAQVVELRIFGGLTADEIARMLDASTRTVDRDWKMGTTWLRRELSEGGEA